MTLIQALILSILQGASELFPVSSLGHAVIIPTLLHWKNADQILDPDGPFLPFIVTLHLGTALALFVYYWKDWKRLLRALFEQFSKRGAISTDARMVNLLIAGTIPTGLIALVAEKKLRLLFSSPEIAAVFLIINGGLMIGGEILRRRAVQEEIDIYGEDRAEKAPVQLTWMQSIWIGLSQSLALLPGISRSGATITTGLLNGLDHESAANFSFLLATPIILAAGLKEVPKLRHPYDHLPHMNEYSLIGFFVSGVTAYICVKFLTKYFHTKRLDPFGYYCILLGGVTLAVLQMHHH